jgi:hypothetical protein
MAGSGQQDVDVVTDHPRAASPTRPEFPVRRASSNPVDADEGQQNRGVVVVVGEAPAPGLGTTPGASLKQPQRPPLRLADRLLPRLSRR